MNTQLVAAGGDFNEENSSWCLLALLSLGSPLSPAQHASGATEKPILALENQWMQEAP